MRLCTMISHCLVLTRLTGQFMSVFVLPLHCGRARNMRVNTVRPNRHLRLGCLSFGGTIGLKIAARDGADAAPDG